MATVPDAHRAFLNRYYRLTRHVYDASRRFYLLGRDRAIRDLLAHDWQRLVEIGPGTGRNLRRLHAARPTARYGGIEASDEMLAHASARYRGPRSRTASPRMLTTPACLARGPTSCCSATA